MAKSRVTRVEVHPERPEPNRLKSAVALLDSGQVIIYPTDTVYGLGAALDERAAVERMYSMRRLDKKKPLSLICSSLSQVSQYAIVDDECHRFMRRVLPGPYTFILRATREAPRLGQSKRRTVGVRMPNHPVALALVEALGRPMLSTSAIPPGEDEGTVSDPAELAQAFSAAGIGVVVDAGLVPVTSSSVIDWSDDAPVVIREGAGDVSDLT
ncbi:MAG: L-threonylcarbamoyladenylate synthase [Deltaproteobacteria bacterium]